jgi:hypothetical protein
MASTSTALRKLGDDAVSDLSKERAMGSYRSWQETLPTEIGAQDRPLFSEQDLAFVGPRMGWTMLVTALVAVAGGVGAHHYQSGALAWGMAIGVALVAVGLVALSRLFGFIAAGAAVGVASIMALTTSSTVPGLPMGIPCALHELATSVLAVGTLVVARRGVKLSRPMLIGVAAAGALAGDATLHVICPGTGSMLHVLIFHLGALVAAAAGIGTLAAALLGPTRLVAPGAKS